MRVFRRDFSKDGRHADFHALRATYITKLARANVPVKTAQTLARHSDPKLTLNTYATMTITDLTAAVATRPSFEPPTPEPQALRATGTDDAGSHAFERAELAPKTGGVLGPFGAIVVMGQLDGRQSEQTAFRAGKLHESRQADGASRTRNLRFTKPLLCH